MADRDFIDAMIHFGTIGNKDGFKADPLQFMDYPETVVATLRCFYNVWNVPSLSIPDKKRKYPQYEDWINQLTELNGICPNSDKMLRAMKKAKEIYETLPNRFMVVRPLSIKTLLIDAVRRINDEDEKAKSNTPVSTVANEATVEKKTETLKKMKNFLNKDM
jgi:hypothetical protein